MSFDAVAARYDAEFTETRLARELRGRVWERLAALFSPGARVLELACGTGEDARYLARRGVQVVATDQSAAMLDLARAKCTGLPVEFAQVDLNASPLDLPVGPFDGVFSNFGGLNCVTNYQPLAAQLAQGVNSKGRMILVIMGQWCAWEMLWYARHGDFRTARRRWRTETALATIGAGYFPVYYPSTRELQRAFMPAFRLTRVRPLGLFLPPSALEPLTRRWYFPWRLLTLLDRLVGWPLGGDHTIYEFERVSGNSPHLLAPAQKIPILC